MRFAAYLLLVCLLIPNNVAGAEEPADADFGRAKSMFAGRTKMRREVLVRKYGGSEKSEKAVARALDWLARHQLADGGWSFDHRLAADCKGQCARAGSAAQARNAATAMALLCFLGAGQTHHDGEYKAVVANGLKYLVAHMKAEGGGRSLHEPSGSMYSHGLGAIALCEAYAMTKDMKLKAPAQAAINFIQLAQDPVGGGWRYSPKQAGDTSVFGWQLMALKTGHAGFLQIQPNTVRGAIKFLDSVAADEGAKYGYTTPGAGRATTAIGLLSRMYLGWDMDNAALKRGVEWLSAAGPSINGRRANLYYNYYATQAMFHSGDKKQWKKWNAAMRDGLVNSQSKNMNAHDYGSWTFTGDHGAERGGRLYCTTLSTLILETYYRHQPLHLKGMAQ